MQVLVMDDDDELRALVRRVLEADGHGVVEAPDGPSAVAAAVRGPFDAAILDVNVPGMSGIEVLEHLRRVSPALHVVMLSGAGSEADRVLGFVSGADDYVTKPFSARELAARLRAVQRRRASAELERILAEGLTIDLRAREVLVDGAPVELTRREYELLVHLARHPRHTFSRGELLETVWGSSPEWQSDATVTEHIRRLRQKVEWDPIHPQRLVTVKGVGYRFEPGDVDLRAPAVRAAGADEPTLVVQHERIVYANEAAAALVGLAHPAELLDRDPLELLAPMAVTNVRRERDEEGRWPRPELLSLVGADGREVRTEVSTRPVTWSGAPAVQVTFEDLSGDTTKVRELVTGIRTEVPEAVVLTDPEFRIASFNAAAEQLYGWSEDEVLGLPFVDVVRWGSDEPDPAEVRDELLRSGHWHGVVDQLRRDGTTVRVRTSSTLIRDEDGQVGAVVSVNRPLGDEDDADAPPEGDALGSELTSAVPRGELRVHYHPVVALADGRWVGFEALLRWEHPERGILTPPAFLGLAERNGAIVGMGEFVLAEACRQAERWRREGHDLPVTVNISAAQLTDERLAERVAALFAETSTPRGRVWFEVTETSLIRDVERAREVLHRLVDVGVLIAIDDFGTGWASLTYLRDFPVHALKIDRSFVAGVATNPRDSAIVSSILSLGRELDVSVVAQGVETIEQADQLRALGCQVAQGYLFSRPVPADELEIERHRG